MTTIDYCPNCGVAINAGEEFCRSCGARARFGATGIAPVSPRRKAVERKGILVARPLVFLTVAILVVAVPLLVYFLVGALNDYQHSSSVAYYNTTDELLCASSPPSCGADIKPHATSYWSEDCNSAPIAQVVVYTQDGRLLYARRSDCSDWTGEFVVINQRNGEFVVADSLPPETVEDVTPDDTQSP